MVDATSPLPLYHQLAEQLFADIRAGRYAPGTRIPSEHQLAETFKLGRPTVRQATDALIQRGILTRRRGSGTYVRNVPAQVDLFSLAGTLVSFEARGIQLQSELERSRVEGVEDDQHPLSGRRCVRLVRVSRVETEPVLLEEIDFDAERFPGLAKLSLKHQSLSDIVERHYHMRPEAADQSFRVQRLPREQARKLALPSGHPILLVQRTLHFALAPQAVFARMYCRTDRFVFSQRIGAQHA
ncbi:MAG TPA: GntR family transcriptional regulator [Polyangiales bacterium]|nr:GntR family transcriptional regulator [Polyangiales bacterium]